MIGMCVCSYKTKSYRIIGATLKLSTGEDPCRVTVKQKTKEHLRVVRLGTASRVCILQRAKVEMIDNLNYKSGQMPSGSQSCTEGGNKYRVSLSTSINLLFTGTSC